MQIIRHKSGTMGVVVEQRGKARRPKYLVQTESGQKVEWFADCCKMVDETTMVA